jgi:hypothetical protein
VGVLVTSTVGGATYVAVFVGIISWTGDGRASILPAGVGVSYCPHSDVLPPQDAIIKDAKIIRMMNRFTMDPLTELYLYKGDKRRLCSGILKESDRFLISP